MKRIAFSLAFSSMMVFGPAISAVVAKDNAVVSLVKGDGKKKKKKSCDAASKENCTKGKKSCCAQKAEAAVQ
jgi:hypothetical protein